MTRKDSVKDFLLRIRSGEGKWGNTFVHITEEEQSLLNNWDMNKERVDELLNNLEEEIDFEVEWFPRKR